jgi:translocation and assembly module TamB
MLALGLIVAGAIAGLYWLVGTEGGARWLTPRALARTSGMVAVGAVHGSMLGGLRFDAVRIRLTNDEIDIDSLALEWNAGAALAGELAFDTVDAGDVRYRRTGNATGGPTPALPLSIRAERVALQSLSITIGERTLVLGPTRGRARLQGTEVTLEQIETAALGFAASGDATVDWAAGIVLDVTARWSGPLAGVAGSGSVELVGVWPRLRIAHELAAPFAATTTGELDFQAAPRVDLVSEWRSLAWPGVDAVSSDNGTLALVGTLDDYRFDGTGGLEVIGRAARFRARGTGSELLLAVEDLTLEPATAAGGAGTLLASGAVELRERTARLAVTANGFDPAWIAAGWPGRLSGTLGLDAALAPRIAASGAAIDLRGAVRGYPLALRGAASYSAPNDWRFDDLTLDSDGNTARLAGTLDATELLLDANVDVADAGLLWPGLGGSLRGAVALAGTWAAPRASGRLTGRDLTFAGASAAVITLDGEAGLAPDTPLRLNLDASNVMRDAVEVERARLALSGTTAAHDASVEIAGRGWRGNGIGRGGLDNGTVWRGTLEELELSEDVLGGPWRLDEPQMLTFGRSGVTLATSCLRHTSGALWCSELDLNGRPEDRLVISGQNFELATLRPLLPPALTLEGTYQLSASLFDLTGDLRGAFAMSGSRTRASIAYGDAQAFATELDDVQAGITLNEGRLDLAARVRSDSGGSADVEAEIADVRARDSAIMGMLRVYWPDLSFLTLLSPDLEEVGGAVEMDLAVAGTVSQPAVDGRAYWRDGRLSVPEWGFAVENIQGMATSDDGRALDFDATGKGGDGTLRLTGRTALDPSSGWPTRLTLQGDAVRAVQLPDVEILASPNLDIYLALPDVTVAGSVHVPRASIELAALPNQAVRPSPDAVVHGLAEEQRATTPLRVRTAVDLTLGDDVRYAALQLDTKVTGGLRLLTDPGQSPTATGTLTLTGTYDAYGRNLALERGQLVFNGPLDDPTLDVRAVRALDDVSVGIELAGTVNQPRTRVFSNPAMNEADALSYLLFGRPVSMPGGGGDIEQGSTLQAAALSLGLRQALPAVQRLGTSLGLDELTVQSTASDAGAVMAGKYLSPRVYIRYSYGLFNRIGGLLLRFRVNDRLSLETRSGDQKSMDLLYTVEKE